jgi:ribosomal protein S18 acetylase RimI-like enzyme
VDNAKFDPNGFFFLTYRSHAIGLCMAWPLGNNEYELKFLCSVPSQRNKGVEEALLTLALEYCKNKGATRVIVKFDDKDLEQYNTQVLKPILTDKYDFKSI